jgi:hypothetical protein
MNKKVFTHSRKIVAVLIFACLSVVVFHAHSAHAFTFDPTHLTDDAVFNDVDSMNQSQIQSFLNEFPNSCLSGYQAPSIIDYFDFGSNVPASEVIYQAAQEWGLNPEVILTTLEKEESLVSGGEGCSSTRYNTAMGYDCPDGGACPADPSNAGFSAQVDHAAWQLRFNEQRAEGNTAWDGDGNITYVGFMTQGTYAVVQGGSTAYYDGYADIDGTSTYMSNGATASLYSYTPHFSGNENYDTIFNDWFGSVYANAYAWQLTSQYAYTDQTMTTGMSTVGILPGTRVYVGFQALNTGAATWTNSGDNPINVGTVWPMDRTSAFCDNSWLSCNRPAHMLQSSVAPGQTGNFDFWMDAPSTPGTYDEHFDLVAEGLSWFPDQGLEFHFVVSPPTYTWELENQYAYTDQTKSTGGSTLNMLPGQEVYVGFQALNTGNETWYQSGANPIHVGTVDPTDRASAFAAQGWLGPNRPAGLQQTSVAPGQIGTFEFWMQAPSTPGAYAEHFDLVADGLTWMPDQGLNFYMTVVPPTYTWQVTSQYAYTDDTKTTGMSTVGLNPGQTVYIGFQARNTGNETWTNSGSTPMHVGTLDPMDSASPFYTTGWLSTNRPATMQQSSVAPGQIGTFEWTMTAPSTPGTYVEHFGLVADGLTWLPDEGLNFYMTVK